MLEPEQVSKCGSSEWIPDVTLMIGGTVAEGDCVVKAELKAYPDALFFKEPSHSPLTATVCPECGFTELYATNARALLSAYRTRQASGEGG